jgi:hypothetical protein
MDVHTAWPKKTEQMIGRVAVYSGWAADANGYTIPVSYRVETDGKTAADGNFNAWILGRGECDLDVTRVEKLRLVVKNGYCYDETGAKVNTPQALFWGEAYFVLEDNSVCRLSEMKFTTSNTDPGFGIGKDYQGGRVNGQPSYHWMLINLF